MDLPAYRESSLSAKRLEGLSLRLASLSLRRQRVGPGRGYSQYSRLRNAAGGRACVALLCAVRYRYLNSYCTSTAVQ